MSWQRWLRTGAGGGGGPDAEALHARAGTEAKALGLDSLLALGPKAGKAASAFGRGGEACDALEPLVAALKTRLREHVTVLVKGSRSARMERVVGALLDANAREAN